MTAPTTRCLRLLPLILSLLLGTGVGGQLSLGGADSFLPEHLDAAAAITSTGKTLEFTPTVDASGTNAVAAAAADAATAGTAETASDSDLPGASQADDSLISTTTDSPSEETTLPDFDDYTADETETTTENLSSPGNHISHAEEVNSSDSSAHSKQNTEKTETDAPTLTRRIVFTGPEATGSAQPPDQSTRSSSVVRGLDDPSTDFWLPNWPTQLLTNTGEASRRPSVRFPSLSHSAVPGTEAASPATPTPSYTVTKVPVTQYYFDLASVSPSNIPGPLFDHEDLGVSVSALPSALPDLTQPLEPEDLPSSISDLQSSVLVNSDGPPVTSTPALPHSVTSAVLATEEPHSISIPSATQMLPPSSSILNEVVGEHIVHNTLAEDPENEGDAAAIENTETPEVLPASTGSNQSGLEDFDRSENITNGDAPSVLQSPTDTAETPQPTSTLQPATLSPAGPAPPTDSEPVSTTSSTTPGSVKPSSVRTSQAAKTSRIPLWQLLSQSSPSRPLNTSPPSTPLTSSVTVDTPLAADFVTPVTTAPPLSQSTSIEPLLALDDSTVPTPPTITPLSIDTVSTSEPRLPDTSGPSIPLDSNDPDQVLTKTLKSNFENVSLNNTELNITNSESKEPFAEGSDLVMHDDFLHNTTIQSSNVERNLSISDDPDTSVNNDSLDVHNALDDTHTNIFSEDNTPESKTQHENTLSDDPKAVEDGPLYTSVGEEHDSVVDPAEVLVTTPSTVSITWTPVIEAVESHTESISVPASSTELTSTTVVSITPPEILTGFTPIISSTHTSPVSHSEASGGSHTSLTFTSTAATVDSTITASVPAQDSSTLSAPTPSLSAALDISAVQITDSESLAYTSVTETINLNVETKDEHLSSYDLLTTPHIPEIESTSATSWAPSLTEFLQASPPPNFIVPELDSTVLESLPKPTVLSTVRPSLSLIVTSPEISPSSSETSVPVQTLHITHINLSSIPPISEPSASPVQPELSVTSSPPVPHDVPKPLSSVFYQSVSESTAFPFTSDVQLSSAVPVTLDHPTSPIIPDVPLPSSVPLLPEVTVSSVILDIPLSSSVPVPPDAPSLSTVPAHAEAPVSSAVPVPSDAPEFSITADVRVSSAVAVPTDVFESSITQVSSTVPILPDVPVSSVSVAILPTPSIRPTSDSPTLVVPTATDDPTPTLLPQPVQPEDDGEEGTQQEMPEKESALEEVTEVPPPPPATLIPSTSATDTTTSMTTITTTSTTTTSISTTTTEAATTTPEEEPTTTFTSPLPGTSLNMTTTAPGAAPTLTTTVVLENGTAVVVALPYIRALVDYNSQEFCQHKKDFRSMFAEWITLDLNGSVQVEASDIKFFSMAECPDTPPPRDDLTSEMEDEKGLGAESQDENHTHVYFYVTSEGEADPKLTEKFPLFPADLVISEELMYLLPRVMELEVVRPDESSSQDQLQEAAVGTSVIVIIVICSIVGVTILFLLFFFIVVKRRGASNNYYGRRCTPVSMDAYSMDSVSVYHSFRRKSKRRASGRSMKSYLNQAFDDPNGPSRPLNFAKLTHFISDIDGVHEEFATIPVNMPKYDELPPGVEDKNRYANVIPVPETRVLLKVTKDGRNCEYINANFVRGARNESKYYIATQAPLDDTVADFWRMIWEQETRVVVMLTDFVEKGIDKCADYLPPSETLDCHRLYGDFQVTLKSRDMREKFVVSNVQLKNLENNLVREVAHMWFTGWPASGVPNEEAAFISFILEVRRTRKKLRAKGPIVVHCSPGTGRTGAFLASDMVMKQFEEHRTIDVPRTVYAIRRDRAGAVQTKEQYAFVYRVINLYASKLTSGNLESL